MFISVSVSGQEGLRVLVVEDEFLIAEEMVAVLEDAGHTVLGPAGSLTAAEAVLAQTPKPDVAVLDANLRGETSAALATTMRAIGVPFCICTGYRTSDLQSLFGDVVTLRKPIDPNRLLQTIVDLTQKASG
jgi:CheY-like chemotaxis protein